MTSSSSSPSIVVLGGSNSLLNKGWTDHLKEIHPEPEQVINLSIGAATTAMALYRLLTCANLPKDPVILWEYALNESNYFSHNESASVLIENLEWLLEICVRRNYRFMPVIMYNKKEAMSFEKNHYRKLLGETLASHRLISIDLQELWQERFAWLDVNSLYKDNPHYSTETGLLPALAEMVLEQAALARVPQRDRGLQQRFMNRSLEILRPTEGVGKKFKNRLMDCEIFSLDTEMNFKSSGRLLSCYLISTKLEPAISFHTKNAKRGPYSTQISPKEGGPVKQLKHLLLWSPEEPPLQVENELRLTPLPFYDRKPVVQHTMAWNKLDAKEPSGEGGLIGVLMETSH